MKISYISIKTNSHVREVVACVLTRLQLVLSTRSLFDHRNKWNGARFNENSKLFIYFLQNNAVITETNVYCQINHTMTRVYLQYTLTYLFIPCKDDFVSVQLSTAGGSDCF